MIEAELRRRTPPDFARYLVKLAASVTQPRSTEGVPHAECHPVGACAVGTRCLVHGAKLAAHREGLSTPSARSTEGVVGL